MTGPANKHRGRLRGARAAKSTAIVVLLALSTGCATKPTMWLLNGRSEAEFRAHDSYCMQMAQQAVNGQTMNNAGRFMGSGGSIAGMGALMAILEVGGVAARQAACLREHGYSEAQ